MGLDILISQGGVEDCEDGIIVCVEDTGDAIFVCSKMSSGRMFMVTKSCKESEATFYEGTMFGLHQLAE